LPLGLDLSGSKAKIARANEHFGALKSEVEAVINQRKPYTSRIDYDQQSKCYSLIMLSGDFNEPRLGIIVGDLIHNLRSALDYIISALVEVSHSTLMAGNQFPIFDNDGDYAKRSPRMLAGVKHGLSEIEAVQPFKQGAPQHDPLFLINYFSNADKHRVISGYYPLMGPIKGGFSPANFVKDEQIIPPQEWRPNQEFTIYRVWYADPIPTNPYFQGEISVKIHFTAEEFGKHLKGFAPEFDFFKAASDHAAMIVNTFEAL
jgi:hypothetical protein